MSEWMDGWMDGSDSSFHEFIRLSPFLPFLFPLLHSPTLSPWRRPRTPAQKWRVPWPLPRWVLTAFFNQESALNRCLGAEMFCVGRGLNVAFCSPPAQETTTVTSCQWVCGFSVGSLRFWSWRSLCVCSRGTTAMAILTAPLKVLHHELACCSCFSSRALLSVWWFNFLVWTVGKDLTFV